jgi:hypothetical protein
MSVIKFELKQEHLDLLKNLKWSLSDEKLLVSVENHEDLLPFGADDIYETMNIILNGKPQEFKPLEMERITTYTKEQVDNWDVLLSELPIALEIILHTGKFELGSYKAKYHDRLWKKI